MDFLYLYPAEYIQHGDNLSYLLKDTFKEWNEDKAPRLAAALAYYTIFSMAPLLIIVIAIVGLVLGEDAVRGQIVGQIQGLVGENGAQLIQTMIKNTGEKSSGILATVIGVVTLVLGAIGVFGQLQDALNTIWDVAPKPGVGIKEMLKNRLLSFAMVLSIGFLLLVSFVISAGLSALGNFVTSISPGFSIGLQLVNLLVSFAVSTVLFAAIYKFLPDAKIDWEDVWIGAAITSLLFTIGKFLIGLYLGYSSAASTYGAAGSLVVMLLWIYYSAQILLLGAEFTHVIARRHGKRIQPAENAISLIAEMRASQGMPSPSQIAAATEKQAQLEQQETRPPGGPNPFVLNVLAGVVILAIGLAGFLRKEQEE
ncbi:MAG: YihY/virulence factor BrkB family protein [Chloroflexi bacterium]|nr:YihY/virulence factor BrkB family protein [Chloroflexota bacterium]